jgi:hypothetical protein
MIKTLISFALGTWLGVHYTQALTATCPKLRQFPLSCSTPYGIRGLAQRPLETLAPQGPQNRFCKVSSLFAIATTLTSILIHPSPPETLLK